MCKQMESIEAVAAAAHKLSRICTTVAIAQEQRASSGAPLQSQLQKAYSRSLDMPADMLDSLIVLKEIN